MTIAACYFTPEGVVLGADSTTTFTVSTPDGEIHHFFNHGQKLFEAGERASLGMVTWGLANLGDISHRTRIARLADEVDADKGRFTSLAIIADCWNQEIWTAYNNIYTTQDQIAQRQRAQDLHAIPNRTPDEEDELTKIPGHVVGFCLGGYHRSDRVPTAFQISYSILSLGPKDPEQLSPGTLYCWGMPNIHQRLFYGIDLDIYGKILSSPHWNGSERDLADIVKQHVYSPAGLIPLRDAIDWIHSVVYSTTKGLKFSHMHQMCGGPTEIAVISSDRPFRWVFHKDFDSAIGWNSSHET